MYRQVLLGSMPLFGASSGAELIGFEKRNSQEYYENPAIILLTRV